MRENKAWSRKSKSEKKFADMDGLRDKTILENADSNRKHELWELQQMQGLPLTTKIKLTQSRIRDWINYYGLNHVYVSVSGGKDSTVLAHIIMQMYPNVQMVYVDTGLEFRECKDFIKQEYKNLKILYPSYTFKNVITRWGYPIFGKEISDTISSSRRYLCRTMQEIGYENNEYLQYFGNKLGFDYCSELNLNNDAISKLDDIYNNEQYEHNKIRTITGGVSPNSYYSKKKYLFMLAAPFEISSVCCDVMKKSVIHKESHIAKQYSITGETASESLLRTQKWLEHGCNGFNLKEPKSTPLAFWTEQDILLYIKLYNINYCKDVYGEIVPVNRNLVDIDWEKQSTLDALNTEKITLETTSENKRTGCLYCGFGLHLEKEPNRLDYLFKYKQKQYDFIMRGGSFKNGLWKPNSKGLGFWFCYAWINKYGKMDIHVPNLQYYIKEYGTSETERYLNGVYN